jgi:hypothetical protein
VGKNSNIISINGQRYDARSGALLPSSAPLSVRTSTSVDGMLSKKLAQQAVIEQAAAKSAPKKVISLQPVTKTPKMQDIVRQKAQPTVAHKPEAGKTLMRHAVKKPTASIKRTTTIQHASHMPIAQPHQTVAAKQAVQTIDTGRLQRAQQVTKSQQVQRFAKQAIQAAQRAPELPAVPVASPAAVRVVPAIQPTVFEAALSNATSHLQEHVPSAKQQRRSRRLRKTAMVSGASLAVVAIVGIGVVQNWSTISIRMAANRSGVSASIPGYRPAGYHVGTIESGSGAVAVHYASNTQDGRAYTVTEKTSSWDSDSLQQGYVVGASNNTFRTIQSDGNTLFLFGDRTVTWVNAGTWYTITSNGNLGDDQLVQLANSL